MKKWFIAVASLLCFTMCMLGGCNQNDSGKTHASENNNTTAVTEAGRQSAPGTLTDLEQISQPSQENVGKTVTLSLNTLYDDTQSGVFVYVYDPKADSGRLAVFSTVTNDKSIYRMTIYNPEWSGSAGLCQAMHEDFAAEIIQEVNITYPEGMYMYSATVFSTDDTTRYKSEELLTDGGFKHLGKKKDIQYFFGRVSDCANNDFWISLDNGRYICVTGNKLNGCSDAFTNQVTVFSQIVERFGLKDVFGI